MGSEIDLIGLIGLQRAEFNRATKIQQWSGRIQIVLVAAALIAPFSTQRLVDYLLAAMSLACASGLLILQVRQRQIRSYADRVRRATVVSDGLGIALSDAEERDIRRNYLGTIERAKKQDDKAYFDSTREPGWARLADHICESAFWTEDLFQHSARKLFLHALIYLSIASTLLLGVIQASSNADQIRTYIQTFCAALLLVVSKEVLGTAFDFSDGQQRVRDVVQRLSLNAAPSQEEVLLLWGDYNAAVEGAPLVEPDVYAARRERFNTIWKKRSF